MSHNCYNWTDVEKNFVAKEISSVWGSVAARTTITQKDVRKEFPNQGAGVADVHLAKKFVELLCQSTTTTDEFLKAVQQSDAPIYAITICQSLKWSNSSTETTSQSFVASKNNRESCAAIVEPVVEQRVTQTGLQKKAELLSDVISDISRKDVVDILYCLNQKNSQGQFGWVLLAQSVQHFDDEEFVYQYVCDKQLDASDGECNENIALNIIRKLVQVLQQYQSMPWQNFVQSLSMMDHQLLQKTAVELTNKWNKMKQAKRSRMINKVEQNFDLMSFFNKNKQIEEKLSDGYTLANLCKILISRYKVGNFQELYETLSDPTESQFLKTECGLTPAAKTNLLSAVLIATNNK